MKERLERLKLNKSTLILLCVVMVFCVSLGVVMVIMHYNQAFSYFMSTHVFNYFYGVFYYLFSDAKEINSYAFLLVKVMTIIFIMVTSVLVALPKVDDKKVNTTINNMIKIILVTVVSYGVIFEYQDVESLQMPSVEYHTLSKQKNKTYKLDDLIKLNQYYIKKVESMKDTFSRNSDGDIIVKGNMNKLVVDAIEGYSNTEPVLKGLYPYKSLSLSHDQKDEYGANTIGLTDGFNTYFDYNMSPILVIQTMTHEYVHTKGVDREADTEYLTTQILTSSENKVLKYAGYLEGLSYTGNVLKEFEYSDQIDAYNDIIAYQLTKGYTEFGTFTSKCNLEYIEGVDEMNISTLTLKSYKHHEDELEKALYLLKINGFKFTLYDQTTTIEEIMDLVDEGKDYVVEIEGELTEQIFDNIAPAIANKYLFNTIYQDDGADIEDDLKNDDPDSYYLKPIKECTPFFDDSQQYTSGFYDYNRMVRYLLEAYA